MNSVHCQVVLVTGAASGIGAEVARRLHKKGAKLVLTDLDEEPLTALAAELGDDERVLSVVADVRDFAAMQGVAVTASKYFGGIDVVIANAGIITYGSVLQVDPEAFRRLIDVNLLGVFHTVQATLPSVIEHGGYVLLVSSLAAFSAAPGMAPYGASKAGIEQFANALRLEVAHLGVDVGSAHMSWIDTPMTQDSKADLSTLREFLTRMPGPLGKTTSVQNCAAAFVRGIARRKSRVYCPRWVGLFRWMRPIVSTRLGERGLRKLASELIPRADAEVVALGRCTSSRTESLVKPA